MAALAPPRGLAFLLAVGLGAVAMLAAVQVGAEGERSRGAVVARVGDEVVTGADFAAFLFDRQRESWLRAVDDLLDEAIVTREARRLGIRTPSGVVAQSVEKEAAARAEQLQKVYGDEVSLEEEVQRAYGVDVAAWKREILEPRIRMQHLLMRIVRLDTRRRPRVEARVIVLSSEDRAAFVRRKLESGADFSLLAVQESIDASAQAGGVLPAVARGDLAWPRIEAALFEAEPGAVVGPFPVTEEGITTWHLYKPIRRIPAWTGTRAELLARLEKDLEEAPLQRPEFERWRARMRRDYGVQVFTPDGRALTR